MIYHTTYVLYAINERNTITVYFCSSYPYNIIDHFRTASFLMLVSCIFLMTGPSDFIGLQEYDSVFFKYDHTLPMSYCSIVLYRSYIPNN